MEEGKAQHRASINAASLKPITISSDLFLCDYVEIWFECRHLNCSQTDLPGQVLQRHKYLHEEVHELYEGWV